VKHKTNRIVRFASNFKEVCTVFANTSQHATIVCTLYKQNKLLQNCTPQETFIHQ